jgi:hypothetical protein
MLFGVVVVLNSGANLITVRFVPSWFPGAGWKRQGEVWRKRLDTLSSVPHEWVKQQMVCDYFPLGLNLAAGNDTIHQASGSYTESFTSRHLRPNGEIIVDAEHDDIIKWCAGGLYAGAADTVIQYIQSAAKLLQKFTMLSLQTVSAILSFIHLMALYPEVQEKAQAELDNVVGYEHLPHPSNLGRLTYMSAVLSEVLRFAPVANLALPHKVTQDDEYHGYRIPKETTIIANIW